jgi:hypothetical protein
MRSLKELYEILWEEIKDKDYIPSICNEISKLKDECKISIEDKDLLFKHFLTQKTQHPEFTTVYKNWNIYSPFWKIYDYWWNKNEDENPINRKAFIQKIISTL